RAQPPAPFCRHLGDGQRERAAPRGQADEWVALAQPAPDVPEALVDLASQAEVSPEGLGGRLRAADWPPDEGNGQQREQAGNPVLPERGMVDQVEADRPVQAPRDAVRADLPQVVVELHAPTPALPKARRARQVVVDEVRSGPDGGRQLPLDGRAVV